MIKYLVALVVMLATLFGGFFAFNNYLYSEKQRGATDYKSATFEIEGKMVTLADGYAEAVDVPGSASKTVTRYFGNNAKGDVNDDGIPDLAYLVTQTSGGSGTFFYVVVALQNAAGRYNGTNAILLGDRIAPQTTEIRNGILIVNYADRVPGAPMTVQPSLGVSVYMYYDGTKLIAVPPRGPITIEGTVDVIEVARISPL